MTKPRLFLQIVFFLIVSIEMLDHHYGVTTVDLYHNNLWCKIQVSKKTMIVVMEELLFVDDVSDHDLKTT
jgi:hypothetical protein